VVEFNAPNNGLVDAVTGGVGAGGGTPLINGEGDTDEGICFSPKTDLGANEEEPAGV
jgi:hypothetical protein